MKYIPEYEVVSLKAHSLKNVLVIPVINEGQRLHDLLAKIQLLELPNIIDIVVVDGGSTDGSVGIDLLRGYGVSSILFKKGLGKLSAQLLCAYDFVLKKDHSCVLTIDGNGKDDPSTIPSFISSISAGYDFVQASRFVPGGYYENTPLIRLIAVRGIHAPLLSFASGFRWTDSTQGYRAYSRRLLTDPMVDIFRPIFNSYELLAYLSYIAPKLGFKCIETPTSRCYPNGPVPTKISKFGGSFELLVTLYKACTGRFNK
jgi:dolichol-phosphate mannosyltransferase